MADGEGGAGAPQVGPILEAIGLSRSFGPVEVLSEVTLRVAPGDVHAIVGETAPANRR